MTKDRSGWLVLLCGVVGLGVTIWFASRTQPGTVFGAFEGADHSRHTLGTVGAGIYGFFFTLLGATLGVIYRRLIELRKADRKTIRIAEILSYLAGSIDYKVALVGAPIVFGLIWRTLSETPLEVYTIVALENGFVSNAVISQFVTRSEKPPATEG